LKPQNYSDIFFEVKVLYEGPTVILLTQKENQGHEKKRDLQRKGRKEQGEELQP
jgi:hypothetical protein